MCIHYYTSRLYAYIYRNLKRHRYQLRLKKKAFFCFVLLNPLWVISIHSGIKPFLLETDLISKHSPFVQDVRLRPGEVMSLAQGLSTRCVGL